MGEPAAAKITLLAALAALGGSHLAAEYGLMLAASFVGAALGLSLHNAPLTVLRRIWHVIAGIALALVVTPMGAAVALGVLPTGWALTIDIVLPVVALIVGMFWHRALTKWAPAVMDKFFSSADHPKP